MKTILHKTLLERARAMRARPTTPEDILWYQVLRKKRTGYKFTRQKPKLTYILDFYCPKLRLAIEVDGVQHRKGWFYDGIRSQKLNDIGIKVIRIKNHQVRYHLPKVIHWIQEQIAERAKELGHC